MNKEYISISEFAKAVGVSHQVIYKRLDKDLQPWLYVANGKTQLNIKALELFYVEKVATNSTKSATESTTVKVLIRELEFKNKEIEQLREDNRRLSEKLLSLSYKAGNTQQIISHT